VGAVVNTARVMPGQSVAVIGLGGVGLNAVLGARLAGARRIIALDLVAEKLALARELGATDAFDAGDADCARAVRDVTAGGVDVAFEMAGSVKAMALAWQVTRRGGATVTAGLPHPDHRFELPQVALVGEERTVRGSYIGSCVPIRDVPRYVELYRQGRLAVDRLLSERVGLDELNEAFDRLATGRTIRQVLVL
jgi:alcohol dehydrogenase